MAKRLTPVAVKNARARAASYEIKDSSSALRLIVQPSGAKSWAVRYRRPPPDGRTAKLTHDLFVPLAEARQWAADALAELAQGRDPGLLKVQAKEAEEKAAAERAADTIDHWAKLFLERHARKNTRRNSWRQAQHVFDNIVLPAWSGRSVHDVTRKDVRQLIEDIAEDRPVMANRALSHLRKFCSWLVEHDALVASPCTGVRAPHRETARDRVLTDEEIVRLWHACDAIGGPAGAAVKLLLLTGQRVGEVVSGMRRSAISGDVWSLSPSQTKNKKAHDVPLSAKALAIINAMPVVAGQEDFVFTASHAKPLGSLSRAKAALDAHMKPDAPWVLHDLRRVVASGMARLGIALPVIEKVLNHQSGTFKGVLAVYQRHDFASEKRHALEAWAAHVNALVRGESIEKVVRLRG
jgi:integrase